MISAKRGPDGVRTASNGSVSYPAASLSSYPVSSASSYPTSFSFPTSSPRGGGTEGKRWSQLTPSEVASMIKRDQQVEKQRQELERKKKEEEELRRKQQETRRMEEEQKRKDAAEKKLKEVEERK